jgi:putative FmdB family regulatory protein
MPFYEYQCKSCGHELEAMQKVSDPLLKKCPHCGKSQLTRLMSAPVFRLKGGGWYETDFKGDKDNQRNLADRPEDAPKESKETETKAKDEKAKDDKGKDGKDAKSVETKADAASPKESPSAKEKPADKPADKSSSGAASKPASGKGGARRSAARSKRKTNNVTRRR